MPVPLLSVEFSQHLLRIVDVQEKDLEKIARELLEHWSETAEEYVRRRHRELQRAGVPNRLVYVTIAEELVERPVRSPPMSARQVRRVIYG